MPYHLLHSRGLEAVQVCCAEAGSEAWGRGLCALGCCSFGIDSGAHDGEHVALLPVYERGIRVYGHYRYVELADGLSHTYEVSARNWARLTVVFPEA